MSPPRQSDASAYAEFARTLPGRSVQAVLPQLHGAYEDTVYRQSQEALTGLSVMPQRNCRNYFLESGEWHG